MSRLDYDICALGRFNPLDGGSVARSTAATEPWITIAVTSRDEHRWLTLLAVAGLAIALGMAVFGLPPVDLHGPLHRVGIMDPLCEGRALLGTPRKDNSAWPGSTTLWVSPPSSRPYWS